MFSNQVPQRLRQTVSVILNMHGNYLELFRKLACAVGMAEASPVCELLKWYCREGRRRALCMQEARICAHQIAKGIQLNITEEDWDAVKLWWFATWGMRLSTVMFWSNYRVIRIFQDPPPSAAVDTGLECQMGASWICHCRAWPAEFIFLFCAFLGTGIINNF